MAVYYEALCPDSRSFVVKQLGPTYRRLAANMQVELIPYGKATVRKFQLQLLESTISHRIEIMLHA